MPPSRGPIRPPILASRSPPDHAPRRRTGSAHIPRIRSTESEDLVEVRGGVSGGGETSAMPDSPVEQPMRTTRAATTRTVLLVVMVMVALVVGYFAAHAAVSH